jgi:hypothetical protein
MSRVPLIALALTAVTAGGCHAAAPTAPERKTMTANPFRDCTPISASLNLMGEQVLTRVAVTAETIDDYEPAVTLKTDEQRRALASTLGKLTLQPATLPRFELRTLVKVTCEGGKTHQLLASATQPDGTVHLSIDGQAATTRDPLRSELDKLVG